ncbi:hypothetical protein AAHE18_10G160800 [Arachis hypogaea]
MDNSRNRRWMQCDRISKEYLEGLKKFLDHAFHHSNGESTACPCKKCVLHYLVDWTMAYDHLVVNGIMPSYDTWFYHGELLNSHTPIGETNCIEKTFRGDDMVGMIEDVYNDFTQSIDNDPLESGEEEPNFGAKHASKNESHLEVKIFDKLLKDADEEVYHGCKKFIKLSFLLQLYHLKQLFKWSNESFNALLGLLKEVLPDGEKLPSSYYNTKKMVKGLHLKYEMIHACLNDCILFRNELANKNINECSVYGASRWKNNKKKIPAKVPRYFPLKSRL